MKKALEFVSTLVISLIVFVGALLADPPDMVPNMEHCLWMILHRGEKMIITGDLSRPGWENNFRVLEYPSGSEKLNWNSHNHPNDSYKAGTWESPVHDADDEKIYILQGLSKEGWPRPDLQWHHNGHLVLTQTDTSAVIGFEDGADRNFTDIVIRVTIKKDDKEQKLSVTPQTPAEQSSPMSSLNKFMMFGVVLGKSGERENGVTVIRSAK